MQLEVKTKIRIGAPVQEVFAAIVDPAKMSQYFISDATGPIETGKSIQWSWADYQSTAIINIGKVETDRFISFTWPGSGVETTVEIVFTTETDATTSVHIREYGWDTDEQGIRRQNKHRVGWRCFIASKHLYNMVLTSGKFNYELDIIDHCRPV